MKNPTILLLLIIMISSCTSQSKKDPKVEDDHTTKKNNNALIAMALKDGKYGYINTQGKYSIAAQYPLAHTFSNGMACVNVLGKRSNTLPGVMGGVYVFIDQDNNTQFDGKSFASPTSFFNEYALVTLTNGKKGYIDIHGKLVIKDFDVLGNFREGLAAAMKKEEQQLGYIDTQGNWKIKFDMKYLIGDFYDGLAYIKEEGKFGYINKKGEKVIAPKFDEAYDFHSGMACVLVDGKYGFINSSGALTIAAVYEDTSNFSDGLCAVKKDGKWGYIDTGGKIQIPCTYDVVRDFHEGMASVLSDGKVGFINKDGSWAIAPKFESAIDFKNGFAIIQQNKKLGFINTKGDIVVEAIYDRVGHFVKPEEANEIWKLN